MDLYETDQPAFGRNGTYGDQLYKERALELISAHDASIPFFLYYASRGRAGSGA